jgi:hypothetical protein
MKRTLLVPCLIWLAGCVETTPVERIPETFARRAPSTDERLDVETVHGFIGVRGRTTSRIRSRIWHFSPACA